MCHDIAKKYKLTKIEQEYGCPKHWKGSWDGK